MSDDHKLPEIQGEAPLYGLFAEYDTPGQLLSAAKKVRDAGYSKWDTYAPFAIHGVERAMGIKMTKLPWIVLGAGLTGLATGTWLQWWTNTVNYPWLISGKPMWSLPANVPVMFELTVLFSAITTLVAMLMLNGLPHPSHPLDLKRRFSRSTNDKFFVVIEAGDSKFDEKETRALLEETHPVVIEEVQEDRVTSDKLPAALIYGVIILAVAAVVPVAIAAMARNSTSRSPRIHAIGDMDWQPKYKAQRTNPFFADGRAARDHVAETVAVGDLREDDHFYRGKIGGAWARTFPKQMETDPAIMQRGEERFGIYCAPCHGLTGAGDGMVTQRANAIAQPWIPPTDVAQENIRLMPVGELFNSITNGVRTMPAYGSQIKVEDRWAIVLYVRALQRSRAAKLTDVPEAERGGIK